MYSSIHISLDPSFFSIIFQLSFRVYYPSVWIGQVDSESDRGTTYIDKGSCNSGAIGTFKHVKLAWIIGRVNIHSRTCVRDRCSGSHLAQMLVHLLNLFREWGVGQKYVVVFPLDEFLRYYSKVFAKLFHCKAVLHRWASSQVAGKFYKY